MYISIINIEKFNYSNDNIFGLFLYMFGFILLICTKYYSSEKKLLILFYCCIGY